MQNITRPWITVKFSNSEFREEAQNNMQNGKSPYYWSRSDANKVNEENGLKNQGNEFTTTLECLVLPTITERLPQSKIDVSRIALPKDICLADPSFNEPAAIDLLIGSGLYWEILCRAPRNRVKSQPALQNTKLGWIIGGEMFETGPSSSEMCLTITNDIYTSNWNVSGLKKRSSKHKYSQTKKRLVKSISSIPSSEIQAEDL